MYSIYIGSPAKLHFTSDNYFEIMREIQRLGEPENGYWVSNYMEERDGVIFAKIVYYNPSGQVFYMITTTFTKF